MVINGLASKDNVFRARRRRKQTARAAEVAEDRRLEVDSSDTSQTCTPEVNKLCKQGFKIKLQNLKLLSLRDVSGKLAVLALSCQSGGEGAACLWCFN